MFIGNINTIPSIVNLPGQRNAGSDLGAAYRFQDTQGNWFEADFSSELGVITNVSISCWIKIDDSFFTPPVAPITNKDAHIVDKYSSNNIGGYRLYLRHKNTGEIQLIFQGSEQGGSATTTKQVVLNLPTSGSNEIKANTVYLVTAQSGSGADGAVRLRGVGVSLDKTSNDFSNPDPSTGFPVFVIGNATPGAPTSGFPGVIDEVALWPDATIIDSNGADNLFNWPVYKDLMNSAPLGNNTSGNNIQPKNWFRMGENTTEVGGRLIMPNAGNDFTEQTLKTDPNVTPLPTKVSGLPNELYA